MPQILCNIESQLINFINSYYCRMRLRGQNDKNLAIFGHFRKVRGQNGALKL
jgi:hypothetical protein